MPNNHLNCQWLDDFSDQSLEAQQLAAKHYLESLTLKDIQEFNQLLFVCLTPTEIAKVYPFLPPTCVSDQFVMPVCCGDNVEKLTAIYASILFAPFGLDSFTFVDEASKPCANAIKNEAINSNTYEKTFVQVGDMTTIYLRSSAAARQNQAATPTQVQGGSVIPSPSNLCAVGPFCNGFSIHATAFAYYLVRIVAIEKISVTQAKGLLILFIATYLKGDKLPDLEKYVPWHSIDEMLRAFKMVARYMRVDWLDLTMQLKRLEGAPGLLRSETDYLNSIEFNAEPFNCSDKATLPCAGGR